jgi:hypothetical protein
MDATMVSEEGFNFLLFVWISFSIIEGRYSKLENNITASVFDSLESLFHAKVLLEIQITCLLPGSRYFFGGMHV